MATIVFSEGAALPLVIGTYETFRGTDEGIEVVAEAVTGEEQRNASETILDGMTGNEETTNNILFWTDTGVMIVEFGNGVRMAFRKAKVGGNLADDAGHLDEVAEVVETPIEAARRLGREGEEAADIVKNTQRIPSQTGRAKYRVPDELTDDYIKDVKNVGELDFNAQIQDYLYYSIVERKQFILVVRHNTELSKPLEDLINAGWIKLEFLP